MERQEEFKARLERIREAVVDNDLEGLLVCSAMWRKDAVRYVTGHNFTGAHAFAIVSGSGKTALIVESSWEAERARQTAITQDIVVADNGLAEAITGKLAEFGIKGRLGIAGADFAPSELIRAIGDKMPKLELVMASKVLDKVRAKKTPYELERMRKAAELADLGFSTFLSNIKEGKKEFELIADVDYALKAAGAEDNFMLMASGGADVRAMHPAKNRAVQRGDVLRTEVTPQWDGYWTQICRTVVFGKPNTEQKRSFDVFNRALEAALDGFKPGMTAHDVAKLQNDVFRAEGFGEYVSNKYTRTRGHAMGMHLDEDPAIEEGNDTILEPGAVFIIHPNTFLPLYGYMVLGDPIIVTETGYETLLRTPRELFVVD